MLPLILLAAAQSPTAGPPPSVAPLYVQPAGEVVDVTPPTLPPRHPEQLPPPAHAEAGGNFSLAAEVLIWRPRLGDMPYALLDPLADLTPQGRTRDAQPGATGGLRVGAAYRFEHLGWDVGVTYTHLKATGSDSVGASPGGLVYPLLTRPGLTDRADRATSEVRLKYDVFDLEAGRTVALDERTTLRPFAGVRFADLNGMQSATYDGRLARAAVVELDSQFRGAGPQAGVSTDWRLGEGFSLFGSARGGLLYGTFDSSGRETNAGGTVLTSDIADRFSGVVPLAAVSLGASYRWGGLTVAAGYELTHYFGGLSRPDLGDDFAEGRAVRRRGDLSLDGVFLRAEYRY